jgi:hypothetical protein
MACGAIPESFPVLKAEAPAARRSWEGTAKFVRPSEKQYQNLGWLGKKLSIFRIKCPALNYAAGSA